MMMNVNEANVHGVESKNDNESNEHDLNIQAYRASESILMEYISSS